VERLGLEPQGTGGVLVVDDERPNLAVLRNFLEDRWRVYEAESGAAALEIAASAPLDVVVTDQRMPGMSGVDLLEELRRRRPDLAGIVLTAYTDAEAVESAVNRAHVFRFLRKPWDPGEMLEAVEHASAHVVQRRTIERLVALLADRSERLRESLEQVQAQQRMLLHLERLGTIGQLSAGVSHDLRNVMVALRAAEYEIASSSVPASLKEMVTLGLGGLDTLLRALKALNDYARSGSVGLDLADLDPGSVVSDAIAIARMDPLFKQRVVQCDLARGLPPLRADRHKLVQVLLNLVRNGLQATGSAGTVRVTAAAEPGGQVEFAVEDDGPGVPAPIRERLFQPFVSDKGDRGLGLGLYMARLIVQSHGGTISVGEAPRGGARFRVLLPSDGAAAAAAAEAPLARGAG
jgi:signal transduction histidine kinase